MSALPIPQETEYAPDDEQFFASHDLVRVFDHADYKKDGKPFGIDFNLSYLLHTVAGKTTIFAFVASAEMALSRARILVD